MRYVGGKTRISKQLAEFIQTTYGPIEKYFEPFCGMFSVGEHIIAKEKKASDNHSDLILLWQALQEGWIPPENLTKEEWVKLKIQEEPSPLRAFAGFGCAHSGVWFCSYAKDNTGRNYAKNAHNSLLKKAARNKDVIFSRKDYTSIKDIENTVIYCDPPYKGTGGFKAFDHEIFWEWVKALSSKNVVLVSEYTAPLGFEAVWEKRVNLDLKDKKARIEKLFKYNP